MDFDTTIDILKKSLDSIDKKIFSRLLNECLETLENGKQIIASGLGKNVPICEKFVGSMISMGLRANFLHTNSAVHGDAGMIKDGDLVILLTKSGETSESIFLAKNLINRKIKIWLFTFNSESTLVKLIGREHSLIASLVHEGDLWNVMPNNSTTINLILLQTLAMDLAKELKLDLYKDFKPNHPGGAIGDRLK